LAPGKSWGREQELTLALDKSWGREQELKWAQTVRLREVRRG
jgi:hypothetical protein